MNSTENSPQNLYFESLKNAYQNRFQNTSWMDIQLGAVQANLIERKVISENLLNHLLPVIGIHPSLSLRVELYPLLEGVQNLNPQYCRHDEIRRVLEKSGVLTENQISQLQESIIVFLDFIKSTALNPEKIKSTTHRKWLQIFPEKHAWTYLKWLRETGVRLPSSKSGYFSWKRFSSPLQNDAQTGQKISKNQHDEVNEWIQACESQTVFDSAFEADRYAAAFAGRGQFMELSGPCGFLPDCDSCLLQKDCSWKKQALQQTDASLEEKLIRNQLSESDVPELMTWLLSQDDQEAKALQNNISIDAPLKSWNKERKLELVKQLPQDSKLLLRLEALKKICGFYAMEKLQPQTQYRSSRDIFNHFHENMRSQKQEQFLIVLLDNKHRYLSQQDVTKGILNKSLVHPREVFASAIENRAAALICVHNHPSGDPQPSQEDLKITERLVEVGKLVGIPILDHIILGEQEYISFADEGLL